LCHFATLPSVIVSESLGIVITSTPAGISAEAVAVLLFLEQQEQLLQL
jgi:hypothetical protein